MALNNDLLKNKIVNLMKDMLEREETSIEEFAERLTEGIEDYVKSATIKYTSGLTAPNGAVTGTFNGNLE